MTTLFNTPVEFEAAFRSYWKITTKLPNVGVMVGDTNGDSLFVNKAARRIYFDDENFDPVGKTLEELEGPEIAAERSRLIQHVCATGEPIMIRHTRLGVRLESIVFPWKPHSSEGPPKHVVAFTRAVGPDTETELEDIKVFESAFASWGQLDALTDRQLEVLAALRSGLSQKEAAKTLGVTAKTIETHRDQLIRRLGLSSTLQAIRMADRAGLTLENARTTRHRGAPWRTAT